MLSSVRLERQVDDEVNWDEVQNLGSIGIDEVAHQKGRQKLPGGGHGTPG
jgi:hypothetical protein